MILRVLPLASYVILISSTPCPWTLSLFGLRWGKDSTLSLGWSPFLTYSVSWLYVTTLTITLPILPSRILVRTLTHFHLYGYSVKPVFNYFVSFSMRSVSMGIHTCTQDTFLKQLLVVFWYHVKPSLSIYHIYIYKRNDISFFLHHVLFIYVFPLLLF